MMDASLHMRDPSGRHSFPGWKYIRCVSPLALWKETSVCLTFLRGLLFGSETYLQQPLFTNLYLLVIAFCNWEPISFFVETKDASFLYTNDLQYNWIALTPKCQVAIWCVKLVFYCSYVSHRDTHCHKQHSKYLCIKCVF